MKTPAKIIQVLIVVILLLATTNVFAKKKARHKSPAEPVEAPLADPSIVRLKLVDGANIDVDEARETEQGIWYRRGGMNHLIARDRVKKIQRPDNTLSAPVAPAKDDDAEDAAPVKGSGDGPVWIYLVGGAKF